MSLDDHDHHRACPQCSLHDHTDTRAFAFDEESQPVPAWWFACPRCGTVDAQVYAARWTTAGLAWMREHAQTRGTWHVGRHQAAS